MKKVNKEISVDTIYFIYWGLFRNDPPQNHKYILTLPILI